jgi:hypothetical protein
VITVPSKHCNSVHASFAQRPGAAGRHEAPLAITKRRWRSRSAAGDHEAPSEHENALEQSRDASTNAHSFMQYIKIAAAIERYTACWRERAEQMMRWIIVFLLASSYAGSAL